MDGARQAAERMQAVLRGAAQGLIDRDVLVELIVLAAIAGEHVLVVGEPGTAKSEAVRRVAHGLGGRYFEYLLGRFTEPSELFGPIDLHKLQQGKFETQTHGMLPEAEIAFLDEVFQGSTAILNTLLGLLNERRFRRGHTVQQVPLKLCVGASNALPEDPSLAAFADRFLVRVFVSSVSDTELEALLQAGRALQPSSTAPAGASIADLELLSKSAAAVDLGPIVPDIAHAIRLLRKAGVSLSDRRLVRAQRLIAAAACLAGASSARRADLWPLVYVVPTLTEQDTARTVLNELLASSESPLQAAAFDASAGPAARAGRIATAARALLDNVPEVEARPAWNLRLEAVLREIDASFPTDRLPAPLPELRQQLVQQLG
jgi:MoxR-like ATPase